MHIDTTLKQHTDSLTCFQ